MKQAVDYSMQDPNSLSIMESEIQEKPVLIRQNVSKEIFGLKDFKHKTLSFSDNINDLFEKQMPMFQCLKLKLIKRYLQNPQKNRIPKWILYGIHRYIYRENIQMNCIQRYYCLDVSAFTHLINSIFVDHHTIKICQMDLSLTYSLLTSDYNIQEKLYSLSLQKYIKIYITKAVFWDGKVVECNQNILQVDSYDTYVAIRTKNFIFLVVTDSYFNIAKLPIQARQVKLVKNTLVFIDKDAKVKKVYITHNFWNYFNYDHLKMQLIQTSNGNQCMIVGKNNVLMCSISSQCLFLRRMSSNKMIKFQNIQFEEQEEILFIGGSHLNRDYNIAIVTSFAGKLYKLRHLSLQLCF